MYYVLVEFQTSSLQIIRPSTQILSEMKWSKKTRLKSRGVLFSRGPNVKFLTIQGLSKEMVRTYFYQEIFSK